MSEQDVQDLQQKYRPTISKHTALYYIVHMGYFLSLCAQNQSWVFAAKKLVPFKVPVVSDNWICCSLFLDELGSFFLKPSQTTCGDVGAVWRFFFKVLWPWDYFLQFFSCGPWRVFSKWVKFIYIALLKLQHTKCFTQYKNTIIK